MKNQVRVIALAAAFVAVMGIPSHAAFQSLVTAIRVASVTVGGVPLVDFTMTLRDATNPIGSPVRTEVNWTGVTAGQGWTIASQAIVINSTITNTTGGIQIYTDNTNVGAVPRFADPTPTVSTNTDSNPGGLLLVIPGLSTSTKSLPLAWSIKSSSKTVGGALPLGITSADPNKTARCPGDPTDLNAFQWLHMLDLKTPAMDRNANGIIGDTTACPVNDSLAFGGGTTLPAGGASDTFATMLNVDGIHFGQAPTEFSTEDPVDGQNMVVYIQANFVSALPQKTYRTSRMVVESFTN